MKRLTLLSAVVSGFLLMGAKTALADQANCSLYFGAAGTINAGECQVSASNTHLTGTVTLVDTLHLLNGAIITVDSPSLTINFTGSGHGLIMDAGSMIDGGDAGCFGDNTTAFPITINATGDIDVQGPGPGGSPPGAIIRSNGCSGGAIVIKTTAGSTIDIDGTVESVGTETGQSPHQPPGGGPITIVAGCSLTVSKTGLVSSRGRDPGADLVHLEGCTVSIFGIVESTGPGHSVPDSPANHCNVTPVDAAHPGGNFTGCVEIWSGTTVTIDSTGTNHGEVNADIGFSGGATGRGWIDIYANGNINIIDGTGNDHDYFCAQNSPVPSTFAVHSNGGRCQNSDDGGLITIKSLGGDVVASGDAIQADSTGGGGVGGVILVDAKNNVNFTGANVFARGDFAAGGGYGEGGDIGTPPAGGAAPVRAWNGTLTWTAGTGDVRPTGVGDDPGHLVPAADRGEINLEACGALTLGATFPTNGAAVPPFPVTSAGCGGGPTKLTAGSLPTGDCLKLYCGASKSGTKFNDSNGNHLRDAFEPGLPNWTIKIFDTLNNLVDTQVTDVNGAYSFTGLQPGFYNVCEVPKAGWTQTCPVAGSDCNGNPANTIDCSALTGPPATIGYSIILADRENETGNDFGNRSAPPPPPPLPPKCVEDPARTDLMTRVVDPIKTGGGGVPGNPAFYQTVQAAYNAARDSAVAQSEVIGLFANTTENLVLDGSKAITITQCTVARVTANSAAYPVWKITATGKLTIIGPDSVGGTIGWQVAGGGGHTLKSIRANGASVDGVLVTSSNNSLSFNDVSGNGNGTATAAGIRVEGGSNKLQSGTIGPNNGDGIQLTGGSNTVSGMNNIASNTGNGVLVSGSSNTVTGNGRLNKNTKNGIFVSGSSNTMSNNASESGKGNTLNGIHVSAGSGNQLSDNKMQSNGQAGFNLANGTSTNVKNNANSNNAAGKNFVIGTNNNANSGGNKKNGTSFSFGAAGGSF